MISHKNYVNNDNGSCNNCDVKSVLMRKSTEEILEEYSLKFIFLCKKSSSARKSCNIFFMHPRSDRFLQSY